MHSALLRRSWGRSLDLRPSKSLVDPPAWAHDMAREVLSIPSMYTDSTS